MKLVNIILLIIVYLTYNSCSIPESDTEESLKIQPEDGVWMLMKKEITKKTIDDFDTVSNHKKFSYNLELDQYYNAITLVFSNDTIYQKEYEYSGIPFEKIWGYYDTNEGNLTILHLNNENLDTVKYSLIDSTLTIEIRDTTINPTNTKTSYSKFEYLFVPSAKYEEYTSIPIEEDSLEHLDTINGRPLIPGEKPKVTTMHEGDDSDLFVFSLDKEKTYLVLLFYENSHASFGVYPTEQLIDGFGYGKYLTYYDCKEYGLDMDNLPLYAYHIYEKQYYLDQAYIKCRGMYGNYRVEVREYVPEWNWNNIRASATPEIKTIKVLR